MSEEKLRFPCVNGSLDSLILSSSSIRARPTIIAHIKIMNGSINDRSMETIEISKSHIPSNVGSESYKIRSIIDG